MTFDKTMNRQASLQGADFVVNTVYVLGHVIEAQMRRLAADKSPYDLMRATLPAGTVSEQVICLTDLLATFASLLNAPLPKGNAEDSFDVLRAFTEAKPGPPVRDHVILQAADATYDIRMGDWKFIERANAPEFTSVRNKKKTEAAAKKKKAAALRSDELFNLKADPSETKDVLTANAELAAKLKKLLVESRDRGFTRPGAGN